MAAHQAPLSLGLTPVKELEKDTLNNKIYPLVLKWLLFSELLKLHPHPPPKKKKIDGKLRQTNINKEKGFFLKWVCNTALLMDIFKGLILGTKKGH